MSSWKQIGAVMPWDLRGARGEAHHAVQWLARMTRAFCTPATDDSHTSLTWDEREEALFTRQISDGLMCGFRIRDCSLLMQSGDDQFIFDMKGHTDREVGEWISESLSRHGLQPDELKTSAPYVLPDHPLDAAGVYGNVSEATFEELATYYSNAAYLLEEVRRSQKGASPVRCWPHHFDIATLILLDRSGGEEARSIGVGCSPGDETYPEPYFYISPWPYPSASSALSPASPPAFWHREGFTAIILQSRDVLEIVSAQGQEVLVRRVLEESVGVNRSLLTR